MTEVRDLGFIRSSYIYIERERGSRVWLLREGVFSRSRDSGLGEKVESFRFRLKACCRRTRARTLQQEPRGFQLKYFG